MEEVKWVCTDPDEKQYGRHLGGRVFEFKQNILLGDDIIRVGSEIDLDDYTDDEINDHLSPYGWSITELINDNESNVSAEWIMAECIFEQTIFDYIT